MRAPHAHRVSRTWRKIGRTKRKRSAPPPTFARQRHVATRTGWACYVLLLAPIIHVRVLDRLLDLGLVHVPDLERVVHPARDNLGGLDVEVLDDPKQPRSQPSAVWSTKTVGNSHATGHGPYRAQNFITVTFLAPKDDHADLRLDVPKPNGVV